LKPLPPYSVKYEDTNDYHWPLISEKDDTAFADKDGKVEPLNGTRGPFGFGDAVQLNDDKCIVKSGFGKKGDKCIMHPKDCKDGLSFSIWEKVIYQEDVLNVMKDHDKKYVFSTGGDFNTKTKNLYPGVAIYHQGMDLVAVVSTDEDVWQLKVRGQLMNQTWSNIGIRWGPYDSTKTDKGGLELYVNAEKVGHAIKPELRPENDDPDTVDMVERTWTERPTLSPVYTERTWRYVAMDPPIAMIGCHRHFDDATFRDFSRPGTSFDELTVWTRKLQVNRTHNEILYFTAGYDDQFEGLTLEKWTEMLDRVELFDPSQLEIAGLVSSQFSAQAKELAAKLAASGEGADEATNEVSEELNNNVQVDLDSGSAGSSGKIYERTEQQQKDYDRSMLDYDGARKLLNFDGLKVIEKPRYLVKRWTVLPTASEALVDNEDNIAGWRSVMLDPDEEGSSKLVKRIEKYSMHYLNSADFREEEDFADFYDASEQIMMVHSQSKGLTLTSAKLSPKGLEKFGPRIDIKNFASNNTVKNFTSWNEHRETLEIPSKFHFTNEAFCGTKEVTLLAAIYNGYGKMSPMRRNPQSIRAKDIKMDSKTVSVQVTVAPDPDKLDQDLSKCQLDHEKMRYSPITIRFYHYDHQTSLRKLLWHEDDLDTNIAVRKCVVYNEGIGRFGAWDADKCSTVLTDQHSTVCECYTTGTFALLAEMVEPPQYGPEYDWLWVVKYIGYVLSIILLVVFIIVIFINPLLWEMFHLLRCNTAFCFMVALICMFVAESEDIRKNRHDNITISVFQQFWFLASCLSLLSESFATFRAITGGIIGGKTLGYIPMIYGLPLVDIGVSMFLYGDDYGRDPRAFIGWANETKLSFFYAILTAAGLSVILCFVIIFNISTPQTRKDSVVEQLSSQGTGLTIMVMIFGMTWGFAFPAYVRFPDKETPDFFPIFQVLNAWSGVFVVLFLGMSSSRFRAVLFGGGNMGGSALFKYMASGDKSRRQQMAFGAFFGDGTDAGVASETVSINSFNSGPDSLDGDVEAGGYDSADSLDDEIEDEPPKEDTKSVVSKDSLDDDEMSDVGDDSDDEDEDSDEEKDDDEDENEEEDDDNEKESEEEE